MADSEQRADEIRDEEQRERESAEHDRHIADGVNEWLVCPLCDEEDEDE